MTLETFSCKCKSKKTHRLSIDGGSVFGIFELHLCEQHYKQQDKRFLISEALL